MHGDAGALVSIGLLRSVSFAEMEACTLRQWTTGALNLDLLFTQDSAHKFPRMICEYAFYTPSSSMSVLWQTHFVLLRVCNTL